jgi:phosphoglycerate dehydrogenase-like enzyme
MPRGSLVAVSYPVDGEFVQITTSVLDGLAEIAFLDVSPDAKFRDILHRADVLIGWHLSQELPAGILRNSPRLRFIQLLSAGADSVDFAAIPERLMLASNVGAYAEPMAEYVMAMALALARRLPQRYADLAKGEFKTWERVLTLDGAAILVNVGRAAIVDERALYEYLRDQPEFCARIDTWSPGGMSRPLARDSGPDTRSSTCPT